MIRDLLTGAKFTDPMDRLGEITPKTLSHERADRMVQLATVGVVAWALMLALQLLAGIVLNPWPGEHRAAVRFAYVIFLPALVVLIVRGIRNTVARSNWVLLAVVTVPILGTAPFSGGTFMVNVTYVACLILVFVRPPWSLLAFAAVTAFAAVAVVAWVAPPPPSFGSGPYRVEAAGFDTVDILWRGITLAMLIWLVRLLRDLQSARRQLAARALVIERQRIDDEVARTIGAALELIEDGGHAAAGLVSRDPETAAAELRAITARSRAALADARRMLTGYRDVSLEAELRAATTLLAAAGIHVTVVLPDGDLPSELPGPPRAKLRAAVAEALGDTRDCVLVLSGTGPDDLDIRLQPRTDPAGQGTA